MQTTTISNMETLEVGTKDDIATGKATIKTVIENNKVEEFEINILAIDKNSKTKNICTWENRNAL